MTYSQQSIDSVICKMREDISSRPSELIYLQTGKDIYEAGEDLWFKAYQLDVQTFGLSDKSKTCLLYTSPSPRDPKTSRMPSSA